MQIPKWMGCRAKAGKTQVDLKIVTMHWVPVTVTVNQQTQYQDLNISWTQLSLIRLWVSCYDKSKHLLCSQFVIFKHRGDQKYKDFSESIELEFWKYFSVWNEQISVNKIIVQRFRAPLLGCEDQHHWCSPDVMCTHWAGWAGWSWPLCLTSRQPEVIGSWKSHLSSTIGWVCAQHKNNILSIYTSELQVVVSLSFAMR